MPVVNENSAPKKPQQRLPWRRLGVATMLAALLHVLFFFVIAPRLRVDPTAHSRTEVVRISPEELARLKKKILKDKHLHPLLKQEQDEKYKTEEAPDDAKMMGAFNQKVPKEKVAGPQPDEPLDGGGSRGRSQPQKKQQAQQPRKRLDLSRLGLGSKVPPPLPPAERERENPNEQRQSAQQGPPGPPRPYRPLGRDDKSLERGDQNLLNAAESKFYSFFSRLEEPIVRNWYFLLRTNDPQIRQEMHNRKVAAGAELPITIEFVLDRQGNFRSIDVVESSRVPILDWVTRESVRKLGAIPNPPPDLFEGAPFYTRRLRFVVYVSEAPMINMRPDLYW